MPQENELSDDAAGYMFCDRMKAIIKISAAWSRLGAVNARRVWVQRALGRCIGGVVALGIGAGAVQGAAITVPNGSFESPTVEPPFPVSVVIDAWQKPPQPEWYDPALAGGYEWEQLSGLYANPGTIVNMDGNQAAYMFGIPGVALFQEVGATYEVGMRYELTVGVRWGGDRLEEGSILGVGLYYRDVADAMVSLASVSIAYSAESFPEANRFYDYQVILGEVLPGDAWAGQEIGVELISVSATEGAGYWEADHVRLAAVPEPSGLGLLALGLGGFWVGRRWWERRRPAC
jgi:hypothetical protein